MTLKWRWITVTILVLSNYTAGQRQELNGSVNGNTGELASSGRLLVAPDRLTKLERTKYNPVDNYCWVLAHTCKSNIVDW